MDYSNLIHDFVDGNLGSAEEARLFSELAANGGLRSEMKQFIEFERTARFDTDAYVPSAQTTANIFARVGIDNPAFNPIVSPKSGSGFISLIGKYTQGIIAGVVTAILTASVMYFGMNNNAVSNDSAALNNIAKQNQTLTPKNANIPIVSSEEIEEPKVIERVVIKYVPVEVKQEQAKENIVADESEDNNVVDIITSPVEKTSINDIFTNQTVALNSYYSSSSLNPIEHSAYPINPTFSFFDLFQKTGLSVEFSGSDYWTFPAADVAKPSSALFENKTLMLMYPLSNSFKLGTEFRQESFYHKWNVPVVGSDTIWSYRSNNNYYSAGVLLRWMPVEFKYFSPFLQTGLGFNQAGPVGRLMLGTEFNPSSDYGFIIGLEGSYMYYRSNDDWLPAKKLGLHYGLKLNL